MLAKMYSAEQIVADLRGHEKLQGQELVPITEMPLSPLKLFELAHDLKVHVP